MPTALRPYALLALAAAIWGFAFVAQRVGAQILGPYTFNAVRFALGAAALLPVVAAFDARARADRPTRRRATRAALRPGMAAGAVLFVASALQQSGLAWTTAGKAGFITGLYIVLVPILGIALRHRAGPATWGGAALGIVGLYLLSVTSDLRIGLGDGLVLAGALFWAIHILLIDHVAWRLDPIRLSVVQFASCSALSLVAALLREHVTGAALRDALVPLLYGGLLSVGVAYTLQVIGQRNAKPAPAAMVLSLESVFAVVGGALLLGESMSARALTGCGLMLAGILLSQAGDQLSRKP